jgi:hypothetical protein
MVLAAMSWLPSAQRRLERRRRGARRVMALVLAAEVLAGRPVHAAPAAPVDLPANGSADDPAAGPPTCPEDRDPAPPSEALALKNAAQEMRAARSWVKASRLFREAVDELPACDAYADERLLWTMLAIDTFKQAGVRDEDGELLRTADATVNHLDTTPHGRLLSDYPRLVAARDELRAGTPWYLRRNPPSPTRAPLATRLGLGMILSGTPVLITGTILAGVYSARAGHFSQELTGPGGVYEKWTEAGCTSTPEEGEPGTCPGLRDTRADLRAQGFAANKVVIGSLVLVGVGAAIVVAGLGSYLHGRRLQRRQRAHLHLLPAPNGVALVGRF